MATRRELLKQMTWITAGSLLMPDVFAFNDIKNKKVGVQLYTIREAIGKDPKGSLKHIADLGFGEVENFGYNGKFFGMDANAYKTLLSELGMTAPSGHYMYNNILKGWEKAVEDAKNVGQDYMVLAYLLPPERKSLDDYKKIAENLNKAGEVCKQAGIQLCYHNHEFEFESMSNQLPFDILTNETDAGLVKIELDLYWATVAGQDPIALFKKHKGRVALWHVKDMDKTPKKNFTEVGNGVIDFVTIFKNAKTSGMKHFFVEQDVCPGSPFDSIKQSIGYIKSNLTKHL